MTHSIKFREKGGRAFWFLTRTGSTRLRIHASRFTEEAAAKAVEELRRDNPTIEFKVVLMERRKDKSE